MPVGISNIPIQIPLIPITAYTISFLHLLVFHIFDRQFEVSAEIITFQDDTPDEMVYSFVSSELIFAIEYSSLPAIQFSSAVPCSMVSL